MQTYKLGEIIDILDNQRIPISSSEREKRIFGKVEKDLIPYYGATQQNGRIDDYIFDEELILLGEDGVLFYDTDKPKAYLINGKSRVNNHAHVIKTKKDLAINSYLCYFLNKFDYHGFVTGATRLKLNQSAMKNIPIPLPPLDTQHIIAAKLDKLQSLMDLKKQAITKNDELAKSIFLEIFGDPMTNEKGWEISLLKDICDVRDGTHDSPKYIDDGYPLITSKNIKEGDIDFSEVNFISQFDYDNINKRSKVDNGDILMPMIGTIGNPIIVKTEREFAIKNVALIKFNSDKIINIYLLSLLKSNYFDSLISNNRGGTQKFVALSDIRNFKIPLPPIELQQRFADIITEIESQKSAHKEALAKLENLYQSEMQRSFSM